jgi:two-component system response regulator
MEADQKETYLVIMADGDLKDHEIVKRAARECGVNHVFTSIFNGSQLMDYLQRKGAYIAESDGKPDLLIMDINLEVIDGFEILKFLGESGRQDFPIYILTKTKRQEDVVRAMQFGIRGYFQKPLKYEDYVKMVQGICRESFSYNQGLPEEKEI